MWIAVFQQRGADFKPQPHVARIGEHLLQLFFHAVEYLPRLGQVVEMRLSRVGPSRSLQRLGQREPRVRVVWTSVCRRLEPVDRCVEVVRGDFHLTQQDHRFDGLLAGLIFQQRQQQSLSFSDFSAIEQRSRQTRCGIDVIRMRGNEFP